MPRTINDWVTLLRNTARPAVPQEYFERKAAHNHEPGTDEPDRPNPAPETFRWTSAFADDAGHRRDCDLPFLCSMLFVNPTTAMPVGASHLARVWWGWFDYNIRDSLAIDWNADGPLLPSLQADGIEVWTETELGTMHALVSSAKGARNKPVIERVFRTATWALENLQPDNATNHPWAIHIFIVMSLDPQRAANQRAAADLYAQSLLHNAVVHQGKPDRFSALILWDAAECLESLCGIPWQRAPQCVKHISFAARDYNR